MGDLYPALTETINRNYRNIITVLLILTLLVVSSIAGGVMYHLGLFEAPEQEENQPQPWVLLDDTGTFSTANCSEPISYSQVYIYSPTSANNLTNSIISYSVEIATNLTYIARLRINDVYVTGVSSGFNGSMVNLNQGTDVVDLRIKADSSCTMSIDVLITIRYISTT